MTSRFLFAACWALIAVAAFLGPESADATVTAHYASLSFDVVYARCPRAVSPVYRGTKAYENPNGVNDLWVSATNNTHQQPGCDLALHHSDPAYGGNLPAGDPGREEVLVNCSTATPRCTVFDPTVSLDGTKVVFAKTLDTGDTTNPNQVTAYTPSEAGTGNIATRAILKPTQAATSVPSSLYDNYLEQIAAGAKKRLMLMEDVPWSNLQKGEVYGEQFEDAIAAARSVAEKGYNRTRVRVQGNFF